MQASQRSQYVCMEGRTIIDKESLCEVEANSLRETIA
jgi:hypothetical protein